MLNAPQARPIPPPAANEPVGLKVTPGAPITVEARLNGVALTDELMTAARGLDLGGYDFAVVFDVIARMSGLRPSVKAPR